MQYKSKLSFRDVTVDFLNGYEKWLLSEGKSISTVGIYLRPLRAIMNIAIEEGYYSKEYYPFIKRKYQIPASKNIKKALSLEEVGRIYHYEALAGTWWQRAKDMWLFSYFANGMNIKDIALLRHEDIDGEFIRFIRAKTKNTTRASIKQISIFISEELRSIIERWKTDNNSYLFEVLKEGQDINRQRSLITQFTKMVNTYIARIASEVKIEKPVTTYSARHSFATILKRNGVSTELISESLGHGSVKTTTSYLDSFEDETKREIGKVLIKFNRQ
jgi:integrase